MSVRKVRIWPDPALKEAAQSVTQFDDALRQLVGDLFETMYKANGVGLAATQIAVPQRVLVIDLDPRSEGDAQWRERLNEWGFAGPRAFVNPEIIAGSGEILWDEGCLSVPGISETVRRKERVVVQAQDEHGTLSTTEAFGLYAVALQHEIDHLNGIVFVEHISKLKRDVIRGKMERLKNEETDDGVVAALSL